MTLEVWKQLVAQMSEIEDAVERTENPSGKVRKTDPDQDNKAKEKKDEKEEESEEN